MVRPADRFETDRQSVSDKPEQSRNSLGGIATCNKVAGSVYHRKGSVKCLSAILRAGSITHPVAIPHRRHPAPPGRARAKRNICAGQSLIGTGIAATDLATPSAADAPASSGFTGQEQCTTAGRDRRRRLLSHE
jgi:hypothetical protein